MRHWIIIWTSMACFFGSSGCGDLKQLQQENAVLKKQIEIMKAREMISRFSDFTVGIAAGGLGFNEDSFLQLLQMSLDEASLFTSRHSISREIDEQQIEKIWGMLVQQYFLGEKVPIRIFNLTYKTRDLIKNIKIGGVAIPIENVNFQETPNGFFLCTHDNSLAVFLDRNRAGDYSIDYQDSSAKVRTIDFGRMDMDLCSLDSSPRVVREGDISFNWQLNFEKLLVYRVRGFKGDMGAFHHAMRHSRPPITLNQYQTTRESVFLFGYGPYSTELSHTIETPGYIDRVEVLSITSEIFDNLKPGVRKEMLIKEINSTGSVWTPCKLIKKNRDDKIWERPGAIQFPFLSRQSSSPKERIFYTKYTPGSSELIGEFNLK